MSIIDRYLTREVIKYFCIILATIIGIYIIVDFFDETDIFLESGLSFSSALFYFISKMPIAEFIPACVLLSVLVTFGIMNRNNEIVALKSSGVSIFYLLRSVFGTGIFFFLLVIILSEVVVPITKSKAEGIWAKESKKKSAATLKEKDIWIRGDSSISHIRYFNSKDKTIQGVTLNIFDSNFNIIKRIDSDKGVYRDGHWVLYNTLEQELYEGGRIVFHKELVVNLDFSPDELGKVAVKSETMSIFDLYHYITKIENAGYDATKYKVDFYAKIIFPFVCIIMCITGTGISLRIISKESLPVNIVYGIGTAFIYWIFYSFCLSLGSGGMLNPLLAALIPNLLFLFFGIVTVLNAD
jgi:lipopolysaccharide export system permease protein